MSPFTRACCYVLRSLVVCALLVRTDAAISERRADHHGRGWRPCIPRLSNGVRHTLASGMSGAIGVTALAPIEVLRVNLLVNRDLTMRAAVSSLKSGWFRGNTADVLAAATRLGIMMPTFKLYKDILLQRVGPASHDLADPSPGWVLFLAGALAGATATVVTFPLEVARTRQAVACDLRLGFLGCIVGLWREEGFRSIYSGLTTTLVGVLPFNAIRLASYDLFRSQAITATHGQRESKAASGGRGRPQIRASQAVAQDSVSLPLVTIGAIGAASGVLAATSCFPLEYVRRKQMMGQLSGLAPQAAIFQVVRTEGVLALFHGVGLNSIKVVMTNSLGFVLYECFKDMLSVDGRVPPWQRESGEASGRAVRLGRT